MTPALSRRGLLLGGLAVAVAGCSRGPAPLVTPTASPGGSVREQLAALMDAYGRNTERLGLSVRDLRSGQTYSFRGEYATQSASIAKVMIALLTLNKARRAGEELPFERYTLLSKAIVNSDNDSADALWEWVGGRDAYTALARELGLRQTQGDERSPFWSWTQTTPDDQRTLMDLLVDGTPAVHEEDRRYLLDVMSKTNPSQTWGVGHFRDADDLLVSMKDGWVQFRSLDNLWAVNSIGRVFGEGRDYTAAIMCRMPTFEEGRALVDAIGADLYRVMGSGGLR